jgi:hypothetical protein
MLEDVMFKEHGSIGRKLGSFLTGLSFVYGLGGCDFLGPDCASSAAQQTLIRTVQENPNFEGIVGATVRTSTTGKRLSSRIEDICNTIPHGKCSDGLSMIDIEERSGNPNWLFQNAEIKYLYNRAQELRKQVVYSLHEISATSRDPETKAIMCAATLYANFEDGESHMVLIYNVERTSNGDKVHLY